MSKGSKLMPSGLSHVGIHSANPAALAEFCRTVPGMEVVGGSRQPYGHPIDLTLAEEALLRDVAELAAREGIPWPAVTSRGESRSLDSEASSTASRADPPSSEKEEQ